MGIRLPSERWGGGRLRRRSSRGEEWGVQAFNGVTS